MSQAEEEKNYTDDEVEQERVVPVSESIRYRKRAQSAEKKAAELELELAKTTSQAQTLAEQLEGLSVENKLIAKLAQAGASDLEAAVLLAKARMGENGADEIDGVVAQLKKEKPHLFTEIAKSATPKTAGAKDKAAGAASVLERAARRAAQTAHSRASLQEYMKLRRKF
jgi:hypothetical protein